MIGRVESDFVSFICKVTEVKEKHFTIQLDLQTSYWPQGVSLDEAYGESLELVREDVASINEQPLLGGISGGPVYRFIDSPIFRLEAVGFIFQSCFSDILLATYSNHIDENGTCG